MTSGAIWRISVIDPAGPTLVEHHLAEDEKEMQAVCTLARERHPGAQIVIRSPYGELAGWDDPI